MSYDIKGLTVARGTMNSEVKPDSVAQHGYASTSDDLAAITTADYFPLNFASSVENILVKDFLFVRATDGNALFIINGLNPVSLSNSLVTPTGAGTPVEQLIGSELIDFTGPWAGNEQANLGFVNIGRLQVMFLPDTVAAFNSASVITSVTPLLLGHRPAADLIQPLTVLENGFGEIGEIVVSQAGDIVISRVNSGSFAAGQVGFREQFVSWFSL